MEKKNKIKVLMALGSLGIGGNEVFVMNYFRYINKEKFQVDFLIYDDNKMGFYNEIIEAGSKVFVINTDAENKHLRLIKEMRKTYSFLKSHKEYDVIHSNSCSFYGLFRTILPAKSLGCFKIIAHSHSVGNSKHSFLDNMVRRIFKILLVHSIDLGFSCSDIAGESKYTKKFISSNKFNIINNAIDMDLFCYNSKIRSDMRDKYSVKNKFIIGNVGRLEKEKNQTFLIDVFFEILKKNQDAILLIVGGGSLETELKDKVMKMKISDKVIITGSCRNVEDYYQMMDVFVMPSLFEGLPFTAVEAQVNGLKCVMSDTISEEVNISGDVSFLSLKESINVWIRVIYKQAEYRSVEENVNKVRDSYDLKKKVIELERYYTRI